MGASKRYLEQLEAERQAKQDALLGLPNDLSVMNALVETLQSQIKSLQAKIESDNSFKSKIKDYFIGGIIGAAIGTVFTLLI